MLYIIDRYLIDSLLSNFNINSILLIEIQYQMFCLKNNILMSKLGLSLIVFNVKVCG